MRYCTLCGEEIDSDAPHYYTKCRACYRGAKQRETANLAAELARQRERAERFKNIAIERRHRIEELEDAGRRRCRRADAGSDHRAVDAGAP